MSKGGRPSVQSASRYLKASAGAFAVAAAVVLLLGYYIDRRAVFLTEQRAKQGDLIAETNLGLMYSRGDGVPHDDREAVKWLLSAAQRGYGKAQACLGMMFSEGRGVVANDSIANEWYSLAANQGIPMAQTNLGRAYASGKGIEINLVKAYMWLSLAAAAKDPKASDLLDELKKHMTSDQIAAGSVMVERWTGLSVTEGETRSTP